MDHEPVRGRSMLRLLAALLALLVSGASESPGPADAVAAGAARAIARRGWAGVQTSTGLPFPAPPPRDELAAAAMAAAAEIRQAASAEELQRAMEQKLRQLQAEPLAPAWLQRACLDQCGEHWERFYQRAAANFFKVCLHACVRVCAPARVHCRTDGGGGGRAVGGGRGADGEEGFSFSSPSVPCAPGPALAAISVPAPHAARSLQRLAALRPDCLALQVSGLGPRIARCTAHRCLWPESFRCRPRLARLSVRFAATPAHSV